MRVRKISKKSIFYILLVLGVCVLLTLLAIAILGNDNEPAAEVPQVNGVVNGESPDVVLEFDGIMTLYNTQKFSESLTAARTYAADTEKDAVSRLNMYLICIKSAQSLSDEQSASSCLQAGEAVAFSLDDPTARDGWSTLLSQAFNNIENPAKEEDAYYDQIQR